MNEIDDIKRRAGLKVTEELHDDTEVIVSGVGKYRLGQVKENIQRKIADMAKYAQKPDSREKWEQLYYMLNHAAMHEMIKTIVSSYDESKN